MDLTGQVILAYLEEDDARRVLFRVRPLLTAQGAISAEDVEEFQADGFLRIAPDKAEQHKFKDRMRELGPLCLLDLRDSASAMGKVRPNKNFAPQRGEPHRYIVYSDAVKLLPRDFLYEVVNEDRSVVPLTAQYFLRSGGRISGPYCGGVEVCPESPHSLAPDCERLFLIEMPDGSSRMFYWPQAEGEAARQAPAHVAPVLDTRMQAFLLAAAQVRQALTAAGFSLSHERAAELLLLCLLAPRLQLCGDCLADARLAVRTLSALFPDGAVGLRRGGNSETDPQTRLTYSEGPYIHEDYAPRYRALPWPVFQLPSGPGWPDPGEEQQPMNAMKLYQDLLSQAQEITPATRERLEALMFRISGKGCSLPLFIRQCVVEFVSLLTLALPGGQEEALQAALRSWALPWLRFCGMPEAELAELVAL